MLNFSPNFPMAVITVQSHDYAETNFVCHILLSRMNTANPKEINDPLVLEQVKSQALEALDVYQKVAVDENYLSDDEIIEQYDTSDLPTINLIENCRLLVADAKNVGDIEQCLYQLNCDSDAIEKLIALTYQPLILPL